MVKNKNYRHMKTVNNLSAAAFRSRGFQRISCMYKNIRAITERGICLQRFFQAFYWNPGRQIRLVSLYSLEFRPAANSPSPYTVPT